MKTNLVANGGEHPHLAQSPETARDSRILIEIFLGTLAGILSYVAAVMTTVVEPAGLCRYVWLGICIATFGVAVFLIVTACRNFR
jgi:hypothetical protein